MVIEIPSELVSVVRGIYAGGRYSSEADVVAEALHLLQQREELLKELRRGVGELDADERIPADEVFAELRKRAAELDGPAP